MDKLVLFRISLFVLIACLLALDGMMMLTRHTYYLPEQHKELLFGGFLVWFMLILIGQKSNDDDWAELF